MKTAAELQHPAGYKRISFKGVSFKSNALKPLITVFLCGCCTSYMQALWLLNLGLADGYLIVVS